MTASELAAWYAAAVSTVAVGWEILRHFRSGPRLIVEARARMIPINVHPEVDGRRFISVTVTNVGDRPTTITAFGGRWIPTPWNAHSGQEAEGFMVNADPRTGSTVPYVLKPGEQWTGLADQEMAEAHQAGRNMEIGVIASHTRKLHFVLVDLLAKR